MSDDEINKDELSRIRERSRHIKAIKSGRFVPQWARRNLKRFLKDRSVPVDDGLTHVVRIRLRGVGNCVSFELGALFDMLRDPKEPDTAAAWHLICHVQKFQGVSFSTNDNPSPGKVGEYRNGMWYEWDIDTSGRPEPSPA